MFVGVIGPGGRKAVDLTKDKPYPKIAVIATEATSQANAYFEAISQSVGRSGGGPGRMSAFRASRGRRGWTLRTGNDLE
jgi:hypothetical protein